MIDDDDFGAEDECEEDDNEDQDFDYIEDKLLAQSNNNGNQQMERGALQNIGNSDPVDKNLRKQRV